MTLGVDAVAMAIIKGDEPARGVEDVDDAALTGLGVAHGVGEHRGDAALTRPAEHPRGHSGREGATLRAMADDLDAQRLAEDLAPRRDERISEIGSARGERLGDR